MRETPRNEYVSVLQMLHLNVKCALLGHFIAYANWIPVAMYSLTLPYFNNFRVILAKKDLCKTICAWWKCGCVFEMQFASENGVLGSTVDIAMEL